MNDALIIGGGIIGLTTALELQRRGLTVTLVEKDRLGGAASGAAGGILSPLPPWRCPPELTPLYALSPPHYQRLFAEFEAQGENIGLNKSGLLCLTSGPARITLPETLGPPYWDFEVPDTTSLKRFTVDTGVLFPNVCQVEPPALLAAVGRLVAENPDTRIREHCGIREIEVNKGRATGARTDTELITADVIVLCAGAWLTSLLPTSHRLPAVRPVRGQMIEYAAEPGLLEHIVWHEDPETKQGRYLIPRTSGHILVGSTHEECGFDNSTTGEARAELSNFAERLLPKLAQYPIVRQWAGLRPAASREKPIIGAHPEVEKLFINGSHYRDGIALASVSAHITAQLICGERTEMDISAFKIGD